MVDGWLDGWILEKWKEKGKSKLQTADAQLSCRSLSNFIPDYCLLFHPIPAREAPCCSSDTETCYLLALVGCTPLLGMPSSPVIHRACLPSSFRPLFRDLAFHPE